jgi:hypothetical protein
MTIDKTTVIVSLEGEAAAIADARRLEAVAERVEAKAQKAKAEVREADLAGRKLSLLDRARQKGLLKRSGLEFAGLEFNRQGIGLDKRQLRGSHSVAGAAFFGIALAHGVGATLNTIADAQDFLDANQHLTGAQIAKELSSAASRSIFQTFVAESILRGALRVGRTRQDVIDAAFDIAFAQNAPTALELEIDAQAAAMRAHRAAMEKLQRQRTLAALKYKDAAARALEDNQAAIAAQIAGLRMPQLPIGVSEDMWRMLKREAEERIRRIGAIEARRESERLAQASIAAGVGT